MKGPDKVERYAQIHKVVLQLPDGTRTVIAKELLHQIKFLCTLVVMPVIIDVKLSLLHRDTRRINRAI